MRFLECLCTAVCQRLVPCVPLPPPPPPTSRPPPTSIGTALRTPSHAGRAFGPQPTKHLPSAVTLCSCLLVFVLNRVEGAVSSTFTVHSTPPHPPTHSDTSERRIPCLLFVRRGVGARSLKGRESSRAPPPPNGQFSSDPPTQQRPCFGADETPGRQGRWGVRPSNAPSLNPSALIRRGLSQWPSFTSVWAPQAVVVGDCPCTDRLYLTSGHRAAVHSPPPTHTHSYSIDTQCSAHRLPVRHAVRS